MLAIARKSDPTIAEKHRELLQEVKKNPVRDWYVSNLYNPGKLVTEVAREGDRRIERTYRDKTKKLLHGIKRYRGDVLDGNWERYDANGELSEIIPYRNGVKHGMELSFSDSGVVLGMTPYVGGRKHGAVLWYAETGELQEYSEWVKGKPHGRQMEFDDGSRGCHTFLRWKHGEEDGLSVDYFEAAVTLDVSCTEYKDGRVIREFDVAPPGLELPKEYQAKALMEFRAEHRRVDPE